jgi:hypothetical protein
MYTLTLKNKYNNLTIDSTTIKANNRTEALIHVNNLLMFQGLKGKYKISLKKVV